MEQRLCEIRGNERIKAKQRSAGAKGNLARNLKGTMRKGMAQKMEAEHTTHHTTLAHIP